MSGENVASARRILAAVAERQLDLLLERVDPQVRWPSFFAAVSGSGEYTGHDGVRQYMTDLHEAFDYLRPEIGDMLEAGNLVVGLGKIHYRGAGKRCGDRIRRGLGLHVQGREAASVPGLSRPGASARACGARVGLLTPSGAR